MKNILLFHERIQHFQPIRVRTDLCIDLECIYYSVVTEKSWSLVNPTFYPTPFSGEDSGPLLPPDTLQLIAQGKSAKLELVSVLG
jgi:hypothetical protein